MQFIYPRISLHKIKNRNLIFLKAISVHLFENQLNSILINFWHKLPLIAEVFYYHLFRVIDDIFCIHLANKIR